MDKEVMVCVTGDTWDVVLFDENGWEIIEPIWCQTKAEAIRVARRLFDETPDASALIVENRNSYDTQTIRTRTPEELSS